MTVAESKDSAQSRLAVDTLNLNGHLFPLQNFLIFLHRRGILKKMLDEWSVVEILNGEAQARDIKVPDDSLQRAADAFRRSEGLSSAERTYAWLSSQSLTVTDFEAKLEDALLREELFRKVTADAEEEFLSRSASWDRIHVCMIAVEREGLAQELKSQLTEENADFSTLAREHSLHSSGKFGGQLKSVYRCHLKQIIGSAAATAATGDLIGPVATSQGWLLVHVKEVISATFDQETESAVRTDLFHHWLSSKIQETQIFFPLLDLLACRNTC